MSPTPAAGGDLVVRSADVRTMDSARPRARGFAVRDGRIARVGDDLEELRASVPADTPVLDAGGRTITPGFTDAHTHLVLWARAQGRLSLAAAGTLDEALRAIGAAHARLAAGARLEGDEVPPFAAWGRAPHWDDLERVAPGRAVVLLARDLHAAWVSRTVLEQAGITARTPDPPGGRIGRDAQGAPDGLLYETALGLLPDTGGGQGAADRAGDLAGTVARLPALGITSVHEFGDLAAWQALSALRDSGALPVRVAFGFMAGGLGAPAGEAGLPDATALAADDLLWPFALKGFVDGTLGSGTAWMLAPFADGSGTGVATSDDASLDALSEAARARGWTLALHAIGDRATRAALDAFARWPEAARARLRPRVEHAQLVDLRDQARFGALGVAASMQPVHAVSDRALAERRWGARDAAGGYAWRALEAAGARLAFGSDVPVEDPDPRAGLWAAVTGGDATAHARGEIPARALTLDRAFAAFTTGAAWAARRDAVMGSLAPGRYADFLVWEEDPWSAGVARLPALPLSSTWLAGCPVWEARAGSARPGVI